VTALVVAAVLTLGVPQAPAPIPARSPDMQRAQLHDRRGWKMIEGQDFSGAAGEFGAALQINPTYADALHGLGKAYMGLHQYAQAAQAFERCKDAYEQAGTEEEERRVLATRAREDRVRELQRRIAELQSPNATQISSSTMTEVLNLRQQIRELEGERDPGAIVGQRGTAPSFVSLSLGSAYFRLDRLADAERLFREALAADPKFGEAHSNLALVCLLTSRPEEAQQHVQLAEEARFKINPELKRQIRDALRSKAK
jgi:tetratricopeptide (TPR) repeat protein